jgi:hypothetical protein
MYVYSRVFVSHSFTPNVLLYGLSMSPELDCLHCCVPGVPEVKHNSCSLV